jgi:hypothetical protein
MRLSAGGEAAWHKSTVGVFTTQLPFDDDLSERFRRRESVTVLAAPINISSIA